ncbi:MAG: T9SS type A sorting domain-containing protein [Bacteroidia bacterium]|nr:T9SS type A sorting domain-containing protein [Bacteroidia bacterium]
MGTVACDYSVSINEVINDIHFQLFPNPSTNQVNIVFEQSYSENTILEIKNILGQTMHSEKLKNSLGKQIKTIDVSFLQYGVYFIQLKIQNKIYSSKFIKQ